MTGLPLLLLASLQTISGEDALRHARSLAALGPHAFGSPRARAAADYVAAELRAAGLADVRLQPFESESLKGQNVIGVLRGSSPEFVVLAAHHDSAPDAPGAYDDGGGVGVLIEVARALARAKDRTRSLVFASFDGEESESQQPKLKAAGSRAYVQSLGAEARQLVAALAIDMCGQKDGRPTFHPIAYQDPLRPGDSVITPAWLMRLAQAGAANAGAAFAVGDPLLGLLYQPAVRAFRVRLYADDLSFLQAGLPALFVSDSSFTRFYPHYHRPTDTADQLDPAALQRMGRGVLGIAAALQTAPLSRAPEPSWYAVFGLVLGLPALLVLGAVAVAPGIAQAFGGRGGARALSLAQAALFGLLLWRDPVPWLFCLGLPLLMVPFVSGRWAFASLAPLVALLVLGGAAALRAAGPGGAIVTGVWPPTWELLVGAAVLASLWLNRPRAAGPPWKKAAGPKSKKR
jgi:hypothetical protein